MCTVSFDFVNSYSQDEVVGTEGWIDMPGTGFRNEAFTRLQWHRWSDGVDEIFIDGVEPVLETFRHHDNFREEFSYMSECIVQGSAPKFGLDESRANAAVLEGILESARLGSVVAL